MFCFWKCPQRGRGKSSLGRGPSDVEGHKAATEVRDCGFLRRDVSQRLRPQAACAVPRLPSSAPSSGIGVPDLGSPIPSLFGPSPSLLCVRGPLLCGRGPCLLCGRGPWLLVGNDCGIGPPLKFLLLPRLVAVRAAGSGIVREDAEGEVCSVVEFFFGVVIHEPLIRVHSFFIQPQEGAVRTGSLF